MRHVSVSGRRACSVRVGIVISALVYLATGSDASDRVTHREYFGLMPSLAAQATPPNYTYTVIADVSNCFNIGAPVLNNEGEAAFAAQCSNGAIVVRRGDGGAGPLAEIYTFGPTSSGFSLLEFLISINDNGAVAFNGWTGSSGGIRTAILVGDGGPVNTVVDTDLHTQFRQVGRPSINNAGAVAFMAVTGTSGYDTVVVAHGGSFLTIAGPGSPTSSVGPLQFAIEPALNNNGVAAFVGQGTSGVGLFTGNGGALTTISRNNPNVFNGINDVGRVAFVGNSAAVQMGDGGPVRTVASTSTYHSFSGEGPINGASLVAFWARLASGATGVFIGPDPTSDTVIKTGDVIPGLGTVTGVTLSEEAINDRGQVAIAVGYTPAGGGVGVAIVRADPIRAATATTLAASPSPGVLGQPVTLTATVAATTGVASGQVEFFDGATSLGTAPVTNGVATLQTSALALGAHGLLADFKGSTGFLPSLSPGVPLTINPPPPLQAPTGLLASSIVGNVVTLRWTIPAIGPAPTNFVLEGGLNPGEVLGSIPTNSPFPIFTIAAPIGAFYVRMHALAGAERSGPSNEIRIFVNTPTPPSPPADLLGLVNGSSVSLTWRNTFLGGPPTSNIVNITGAVTASHPVGAAEGFTFSPVPGGTYTFSVTAANSSGASAASNPVTLTFPGACSGAPLSPIGFLAYTIGNTIFVVWDSAASGPAPTGYTLNVSGAFVGSFPTIGRTVSGTAGPGSYGLSVLATNACGPSPATPVQTVSIP
jgi:Bacterial Ig-like domain (group 3)